MDVLLIRHAIAEDREDFAKTSDNDAERPLTDTGRRKMRKVASRLQRLLKRLDAIASSGLTRADETAAIVRKSYGRVKVVKLRALEPGGEPQAVLDWLGDFPRDAAVALVGHEPDLGRLLGYMVCGRPVRVLAFKKGGGALLRFEAAPTPAQGMLRWALTPAQFLALKG
jgi:phosphohistidine phosphatase